MPWTLVTGGSQGLGAALCFALAKQNHDILIHYYRAENDAKALAKQCQSMGVKAEIMFGDFSNIDSTRSFIRHCLNEFPDIQNLINNVGPHFVGSPLNTETEKWMEMFQLNLHAPELLIKAFLSTIKKNQGSIINIGTAGINKSANSYNTAYNSAKSSLYVLTKALAKELGSSKVSVNMVSPGILENSEDRDEMFSKIPMQRFCSYCDVTETVLFLLKNSYITGQNIEVAGGFAL